MSFNVIPPLAISTTVLTNSTVAEPDVGESVYNAATTYPIDAQVISTTTHRKYQSLQANNQGKALPVWPEKNNLWWYDIGPTNRYAMFDLYRNTATKKTGALEVVLSPGVRIDSLALSGLVATSVDVTMIWLSAFAPSSSATSARRPPAKSRASTTPVSCSATPTWESPNASTAVPAS